MPARYKLTRPELKRQRDALKRFQRYLPMLKLRQQQLQAQLWQVDAALAKAVEAERAAAARLAAYDRVLADVAGVDLQALAEPSAVKTHALDIAGVTVQAFDDVDFPPAAYSLFATPVWVDGALRDLRERRRCQERRTAVEAQRRLIEAELRKTIQRVNLFEKIKIPEAREAIRVIRIRLGDELTSAIGRAKIAKGKLARQVVAEAAAEVSEGASA